MSIRDEQHKMKMMVKLYRRGASPNRVARAKRAFEAVRADVPIADEDEAPEEKAVM